MSTILLVEDDPDIRHLVAYKLGKGGMDVIGVADGVAALREARAHPPDLVLLDVRMPRMSGIEGGRGVPSGPLPADVANILPAGRARPPDLGPGFAAGASDYIVKPFSPRELLERVEAALARVAR